MNRFEVFIKQRTLKNINEIGNKYVYLTAFGPNNFKFREYRYKTIE
jgi:hypothetical protein